MAIISVLIQEGRSLPFMNINTFLELKGEYPIDQQFILVPLINCLFWQIFHRWLWWKINGSESHLQVHERRIVSVFDSLDPEYSEHGIWSLTVVVAVT